MQREPIPRLPVFGWQAFAGASAAGMPCMLELPHLCYTTSGRASILLAFEALGIGVGDRVLLPTYHCPTMVAPAAGLHAEPVFYPIDDHGTPDLDWLDRQDLGHVRAMLAAHYFGLPQPMDRIRAWCDARGIALIEDCAHALFGRSGRRAIGGWGDIAIGSLTKFMPAPEGGCIVVNSRAVMPTLRACPGRVQLRAALDILDVGATQGRLAGLNGLVSGGLQLLRRLRGATSTVAPPMSADADPMHADFVIDAELAHRELAAPCRWVARKLPRERVAQARRRNFEWWLERMRGHRGMRPLFGALPGDCVPYVFPLWVDAPDPGYAQLRAIGMPVFRWDRLWPGVPALPHDQGRLWSHHVLQLACHQDLGERDLETFARAMLQLYADQPGPMAAGARSAAI